METTPFVPTPSPFTCETFTPHVGEIFSIPIVEGGAIELELISADPVELKPYDGRAIGKAGYVRNDPFSLIFRGPADKMLEQGIYSLTHPSFESLKLGLVPIGPGETGLLYQASFN